MEIKQLEAEIQGGMNRVKTLLTDAMVTVGIIESMIYMHRKEKEPEVAQIPKKEN